MLDLYFLVVLLSRLGWWDWLVQVGTIPLLGVMSWNIIDYWILVHGVVTDIFWPIFVTQKQPTETALLVFLRAVRIGNGTGLDHGILTRSLLLARVGVVGVGGVGDHPTNILDDVDEVSLIFSPFGDDDTLTAFKKGERPVSQSTGGQPFHF